MQRIVLLILVFTCCCLGCSSPQYWKPHSVAERARKAKLVVYGKVIQRNSGNSHQYGHYKVKFEVFCVLKGRRTPRFITISRLGFEPGLCTHSKALVNRTYIAFLKPRSHSWKLYKVDEINVQTATMEVKNTKRVKRLLSNLKTIPMLPKGSPGGDKHLWGCVKDLGFPFDIQTTPTSDDSSISAHKQFTSSSASESSEKNELFEKAHSSSNTNLFASSWVRFTMTCFTWFISRLLT